MTAPPDAGAIAARVAAWYPSLADRRQNRCHTDATDFYQVGYSDVLVLGNHAYLILNNTKVGRFGLDDQEKFRVKRAIDSSGIGKSGREKFSVSVSPLDQFS